MWPTTIKQGKQCVHVCVCALERLVEWWTRKTQWQVLNAQKWNYHYTQMLPVKAFELLPILFIIVSARQPTSGQSARMSTTISPSVKARHEDEMRMRMKKMWEKQTKGRRWGEGRSVFYMNIVANVLFTWKTNHTHSGGFSSTLNIQLRFSTAIFKPGGQQSKFRRLQEYSWWISEDSNGVKVKNT